MPSENLTKCATYFLQWLQSNGAILASITALFIAIFQDRMRAWVMKPVLDITIDLKPPDCLKIPSSVINNTGVYIDSIDTYYFRLKVINTGNKKAEKVEVFASKLMEEQSNNQWKEVNSFLPMNLVWANDHTVFYEMISPKMHRHCDLAHVMDPKKRVLLSHENKTWLDVQKEKTILSFDTHAKPNTLCYLYPPGNYRLVVIAGAANAKPIRRTVEIKLDGMWYETEDKMFGTGISIRIYDD